MAVTSQVPLIRYIAGGGTEFSFPFRVPVAEHLKVFVSGVQIVSGYSLTGVGEMGGGTLTFDVAPPIGTKIVLARQTPIERSSDYVEGGALRASELDDDFDALTYMVQDIRADAITTTEFQTIADQIEADKEATFDAAASAASSASTAIAARDAAAGTLSAVVASANAASTSANQANNKAIEAAASASSASTSATNAAGSASAALASANTATTQASNASASAVAAAASASSVAGEASAAASSAAAAANTLALVQATAANFPGRNKIINGKMTITQRGAVFANPTGQYTLDRWFYAGNAGNTITVSQQADAPANGEFEHSLRLTTGTPDTSIAASDNVTIGTSLEGYNARDLRGRTFTLSFWVRSPATGTHCVAFRNTGATLSRIETYTVTVANTWEFKTITVAGGLPTTGTWNWTTGLGLQVDFVLAAGSSFHGTAGSWLSANRLATSAQVNCVSFSDATFALTGVQLEVGSAVTPFEHRPVGLELTLCQRYFEAGPICVTNVASHTYINFPFKVRKRAGPTVVVAAGGQTWNSHEDGMFATTVGSLISQTTYTASAEL